MLSSAASGRIFLFRMLSLVYFGGILAGALLMQALYSAGLVWPFGGDFASPFNGDLLVLFVGIFLDNLILSAFLLVTLAGLVFFFLPFIVLAYRAAVWGMLIQGLSTPQFIGAFPTFILEGVGYVLAGVAGVVLGLSWLRPSWAFKSEELSRKEAFRKAYRECAKLYVLVVAFLFLAAIAEVLTIAYL